MASPDYDYDDYEIYDEYENLDDYEYYEYCRSQRFADPGGVSALRAATPTNPRNLPCPTCGEPDRLTPLDRQLGYQCDCCAREAERGW